MKNVLKVSKRLNSLLAVTAFLCAWSTDIWAMASPGGEGQESPGGAFGLFAPMILVFVIFYFLLIRPQAKQKKQHRALIQKLERGNEVVTAAGIHGKITSVTEETVGVEIADNVRIRLDKGQIARVKTDAPEAEAKAKAKK